MMKKRNRLWWLGMACMLCLSCVGCNVKTEKTEEPTAQEESTYFDKLELDMTPGRVESIMGRKADATEGPVDAAGATGIRYIWNFEDESISVTVDTTDPGNEFVMAVNRSTENEIYLEHLDVAKAMEELQLGSDTYEEACAKLGGKGNPIVKQYYAQLEGGKIGVTTYNFKDKQGNEIICGFNSAGTLRVVYEDTKDMDVDAEFSIADVRKIDLGDSYEQCCAYLGGPGEYWLKSSIYVLGQRGKVFVWNCRGQVCNVTFDLETDKVNQIKYMADEKKKPIPKEKISSVYTGTNWDEGVQSAGEENICGWRKNNYREDLFWKTEGFLWAVYRDAGKETIAGSQAGSYSDVGIFDEIQQRNASLGYTPGQLASRIFSSELYPPNSEYSAVKETDLQKEWNLDFGYTCMNTTITGRVNDQGEVASLQWALELPSDARQEEKEEVLAQWANGLADILGDKTSYGEEIMMNMVGITAGLEEFNGMVSKSPYFYYWAEKDMLIYSSQINRVVIISFMAL